MRYLSFLLFAYLLSSLVYAGPEDRWVPAESVEEENVESIGLQSTESIGVQFDGIALILGISAFVWACLIYRDIIVKKNVFRRR